MLTVDDIKEALPQQFKHLASQSLADTVNGLGLDPEFAEYVRDNILSYGHVLKDGRFKSEDYLSAVVYISFKAMGYTNQDAYKRTFPQRYQNLVARGCTEHEISGYVSSYNKGRLVNLVFEQTMIAPWILNRDVYQKAINTQAKLMLTAKSEKVRSDAANSILTHLKQPEALKIDLGVKMAEPDGLGELKNLLTDLASMQVGMIKNGVPTREIAHQAIRTDQVIDAELVGEIP